MYHSYHEMINTVTTDDYGNSVRVSTSKTIGQWLVSTNTYGGYDHNHCDMQDAII